MTHHPDSEANIICPNHVCLADRGAENTALLFQIRPDSVRTHDFTTSMCALYPHTYLNPVILLVELLVFVCLFDGVYCSRSLIDPRADAFEATTITLVMISTAVL